jgi:hypothetical protein
VLHNWHRCPHDLHINKTNSDMSKTDDSQDEWLARLGSIEAAG